MKKQIFTLLILIGLVGFSSKLFAQSTPMAPYAGATHTYVVDGLTNGDLVTMGVSNGATTYTNVASGTGTWAAMSQTPAAGTAVTDGTASLEVTWGSASVGVSLWVWIHVVDQSGCETWRSLPVVPVTPVDYVVNFNVLAVTVDDGDISFADLQLLPTGTSLPTSGGTICPVPFGQDLVAGSLTDNSMTDGSTYVYFKVVRTPSASDPLINAAWVFTPNTTINPAVATAEWQIAPAGNTTFSALTAGNQNIAAGVNTIYVRALMPVQTVSEALTFAISNAEDAGGTEVDANTVGENTATLTVSPVPTVGTFGSSF